MAELIKVNAPVRKPLFEGVQGENEARSIQFDIEPWVTELGNGAVTATAKRSQDSQPYPVTVTKDGNVVTWKPTSTDTAYAGVGSFQLEYTVDSVLAKTCIWSTMVAPSLDPAGDPPDPYDNWLAEMRSIAADAIQAADDAEASAESISGVTDEVVDLRSDLNNVIKPPANLVKLSMVEENTTVSTTGVGRTVGTVSSNNYDLAEQIPIKAGLSYESYNARLWLVTDDNGVILEVDDTNHLNQSFTITPSHSGLLYVVFYNTQRERYYVNTNGENKYISPTVYPPQEWLLDVLDDYTSDAFERVDTMIRDSYNLVKANQITQGKALNGNDAIGTKYQLYDNATYDTVIGVKAEAGQEYYVNSSRLIYVVDEFGYLLEKDDNNHASLYTYTPTHDGYFAVSYIAEYFRGKFFINKKENGSSFEGYDAKYPMPWLTDLLDAPTLYGKTIYNFGDSVSQGGHQTKGPAEIVAEECGMICNDYAVGGASMVNYLEVPGAEARSCVQTQIANAPSAVPDFVLLAGGINDLKFTTAGTAPNQPTSYLDYGATYISNLDTTKFSGAFEKAIYNAINKYPTAQVIYMFEQKMMSHFSDGTQNLHDVAIAICKKWGVPVLDMWDEGGLNLAIIPYLKLYGSIVEEGGTVIDGVHYDGTHPNDLGYKKFYAPKLKAKLIECCQTITE